MQLFGITLGDRGKKALRVGGLVALALVSFVFALQLAFPYNRVKDRVVDALSAKYEVVIGSVERGWMPGKMILNNVSLKTRVTQPNQIPSLFYIKRLSLDLGVLALLGKKAVVDIEATIGDGVLTGRVSFAKTRALVAFQSDSLPGVNLPFRELVGLPVIGKIAVDLDFDFELVRNTVDWTKAAGHLTLECPSGCTVGDGKTKIRPAVTRPNQAEFVKDGIEFNKLQLDKFLMTLEVKKGQAKLTKWNVPSKDGEVHVDFEVALEKVLNNSQVTGCLRFNGSKDLEQRDYRTFVQLRTLGAPLGPDNLFHIRLSGPLSKIKRLAQVCGPAADAQRGGGDSSGSFTPSAAPTPPPSPPIPPPSPNNVEETTPPPPPPTYVPPPPQQQPLPQPEQAPVPPPQPTPPVPPPPSPSPSGENVDLAPQPAVQVPPPPPDVAPVQVTQ
jgi:type II secretion system protein N